MPAEKAVSVAAPAKINLYLHVTGRRADGYHLLDSLIAFADVADTVTARPAEALSLEIAGPHEAALDAGEGNLVLRAARAFAALHGIARGAHLTLVKTLPVAAGLGGGSSDAAATFVALAGLWGVAADRSALMRIGATLGADVPVCVHGGPALVGGVGEVIEPAPDLPPCGIVLANPGKPLSTAAVFAARSGAFGRADPLADRFASAEALAEALSTRRNDLTGPALRLLPVIRDVLDALQAQPACLLARLSGSGPTCFGLFADADAAAAAGGHMAAANPSWWVRAGRLLGAGEALR